MIGKFIVAYLVVSAGIAGIYLMTLVYEYSLGLGLALNVLLIVAGVMWGEMMFDEKR